MPAFCANLTMMFNELPFMDRFRAAKRAGFMGVEYLFPYDFEAGELAGHLLDNNLTQVLHNLPAGDWAAGERGIAILTGREQEFREGVDKAIRYATTLGCTQVNCLAGLIPPGENKLRLEGTFVANLAYAADKLKDEGIRLLIEPINTRDMPGFFLNGTAQALDIIAKVGSDNLFVQYDIYHMQRMEGEIAATIAAHLPQIGHIQIADNPGRNEPGTGEIAYPFLFNHLDRIGYRGWVGCEYKPKTTTDAGLGWFTSARAATAATT